MVLSLDDPEECHRLKHVGLTIELFCTLEGLPLKPASPLKALPVFFHWKGNYQLLYMPDWKKEFPSTCSLNSFNGPVTKKLWTDGQRWRTSISVYAFILIIIIWKLFLPLFFLFASLVSLFLWITISSDISTPTNLKCQPFNFSLFFFPSRICQEMSRIQMLDTNAGL